jgi:hypothetical protein
MVAALALSCGGASLWAGEDEQKVDLAQVPDDVKAVATKALPGIKLTKAELEKRKDGEVYELDGVIDGKKYEFKIKPDGTLVSIKLEAKEGEEHEHAKGQLKKKKHDDEDKEEEGEKDDD